MSPRARRIWWLLWPAGICFVVFGELGFWVHGLSPRETFPLDLGVSSVSIAVGLTLWRLRPANRTGALLVLAGVTWTIGGIRAYLNPWAFGVGECFDGAQDLVLAHLLIAYPSGRLGSARMRWLVGAGYSLFLLKVASTMTFALPGGRNAFAIWNAPGLHDALDNAGNIAAGAYALVGIAIVSRRWWRASSTARRVLGPVIATAILFAAAAIADSIVQALTGSEPDAVFFPPLAMRFVIPFAFAFGLLRDQLGRVAVSDLVIELGAGGVETLEQALARTLRDPELRVGYRVAGAERHLDARGAPVPIPSWGDRRAATPIERDGAELAVIVHDRALLENSALVESAVAAARLALDNERLQAQLCAQLDALRASRARIVHAGDAERRRLERDLHDGAQQRLLGLGMALQLMRTAAGPGDAAALLDEAEAELAQALRELRELARGIHPAILTDQGLAPAARALATRAPIPVTVSATDDRFPLAVETAGYFVIAEALANVAKYARATQAWVTIGRIDGRATVEVRDDGVGGASAALGSGLAGLADRIGALDGTLTVDSRLRAGTRIRAEIPCA